MRVQNKLKVIGVAATVMLSAGSLFSTAIGLAETETVPVESSESFQKIASEEPVTSFSQEVVSESFSSQSSDRMDTEESNTVETEESETTVAEQREVSEEQPEIESKSPKPIQTGDFLVDGESSGITYQGNTLELSGTNALYTVRMITPGQTTTTDRIEVTGTNVTVKLNGVKIHSSSNAPFLINPGASATVDLIGENELISTGNYAGLQNNNTSENSLVITSDSGSYDGYAGKLTARCDGMSGAGIGGEAGGSSEVTINGGHVTATGGDYGAGIGGGAGGSSEVTISNGYVTATGGDSGAGIGGGGSGSGEVTISGGTVQSTGGNYNSDIGNGEGVTGGSVTINGGSIKTSNNAVTDFSNSPKNTDGEEVVCYKFKNPVSFNPQPTLKVDGIDFNIGGKHEPTDDQYYLYLTKEEHTLSMQSDQQTKTWEIEWDVGTQTFKEKEYGDFLIDNSTSVTYESNVLKLGGDGQTYNVSMKTTDYTTNSDRIEVTGTNVTVKLNGVKIHSSSNAPFLINSGASATVDLNGENELVSKNILDGYAGLQNNNTTENSLVITSDSGSYDGYAGRLTARCDGGNGAGIGGEAGGSGEVTINGGHVTATGRAGIGGGWNGSGEVTISGGYVTATGRYYGAGIGGGPYGSSKVTISGGYVTAIGGEYGAGIGGGYLGNGEVTISGGYVTATGGEYGAGIGGGYIGNGEVTISGGTVQSTGGNNSPDIGNGDYGSGGLVTINGGSVKATNNWIEPAPTDGSVSVHPL
jgi:Tfp pilus assembly protein PilV